MDWTLKIVTLGDGIGQDDLLVHQPRIQIQPMLIF